MAQMLYDALIDNLSQKLLDNKLVILPTDTAYALACNANSDRAVSILMKVKKRSMDKPLPVFISSIDDAKSYCKLSEKTLMLLKKFWPGQVTFVMELKNKNNLSKVFFGQCSSIGLRVPKCDLVIRLIKKCGFPITGTSANISGQEYSDDFGTIQKIFSNHATIIKNSNKYGTQKNISTIAQIKDDTITILRNGAVEGSKILAYKNELT